MWISRPAIVSWVIVGVAAPSAMGQAFLVFTSRTSFNEYLKGPGAHCVLKGEEDFEGSTLPSGGSAVLNDPLAAGVSNGPFPAGLSQLNLRVQSNTLGGTATIASPRGASGLYTEAMPLGDVVFANTPADSLDLIFLGADKCAVGFDTLTLGVAVGGVQISVFDSAGAMITQGIGAPGFFGIVLAESAPELIGRINIFGASAAGGGVREGADNISMYVEVPAPAGVLPLLVAGCTLLRRRRPA